MRLDGEGYSIARARSVVLVSRRSGNGGRQRRDVHCSSFLLSEDMVATRIWIECYLTKIWQARDVAETSRVYRPRTCCYQLINNQGGETIAVMTGGDVHRKHMTTIPEAYSITTSAVNIAMHSI